jgi:hypothetical protein
MRAGLPHTRPDCGISQLPCNPLPDMPWFFDRAGTCGLSPHYEPAGVAFRVTLASRLPGVYLGFAAQSPGLPLPRSTLQGSPYGRPHMTRGQHRWLLFYWMTLSFTADCRLSLALSMALTGGSFGTKWGLRARGNGELRRGAFPGTAGILPATLILGTAHESGGTRQAGRLRSQVHQKQTRQGEQDACRSNDSSRLPRSSAVPEPGLQPPSVLKVAQPSWLSLPQVTGSMPVPPSDLDPKWAISPTETPPPQNVPKSAQPENGN